jgi:hypothetical protein
VEGANAAVQMGGENVLQLGERSKLNQAGVVRLRTPA